ncbi:MAG TPA: SprT family zinc-dependent metalloprotease [Anaerolineaceae bacterium]|nr:SprT family zinc-dependent metalloprotease [Anaerolineaceae bacterium]
MSWMKIDQLIRSKRKTIALIVERDGRLVVRAPLRIAEARIQAVVEQKAEWIRRKQAEAREAPPVSPPRYVPGEEFPYLGRRYRLEIVDGALQPLSLDGCFRLDRRALPRAERIFQEWYRARACEILTERVRVLAARHGLRPKQVRITSARTRWGSCSAQGSLAFTWRLVMAPPEAIDYVVIHELAHLRVRNHSKAFWAEVERMMPEWREGKERLTRNT